VHAFAVNGKTGALKRMCPPVGAGGTSTCYLTIHKAARRMLLVNYWDSTICTLPIALDGTVGPIMATYDPKQGREMKAKADTHVNHSRNDAAAQAERQGDPHSHAIVLDPADGNIAYVPDLGMDLVRQFYFNEATGEMTPCGEMVSGIKSGGLALGPRYISFLNFRSGKELDVCYVVNELSSQVAVSGAFPSLMLSTLTEIYLCHACSCQEIEDENAPAGERGVLHVDADDRLQAVHLYPHPQWRRRAG
jgi:6-phosphogluconolactonase